MTSFLGARSTSLLEGPLSIRDDTVRLVGLNAAEQGYLSLTNFVFMFFFFLFLFVLLVFCVCFFGLLCIMEKPRVKLYQNVVVLRINIGSSQRMLN